MKRSVLLTLFLAFLFAVPTANAKWSYKRTFRKGNVKCSTDCVRQCKTHYTKRCHTYRRWVKTCTGYNKWKTYCKNTYAKRRTCTQYKRVWTQCKWFPTRHRSCYRYHNWVNYCRRASRGNRSRFISCLKKRRHYRYYRGCYRYFSYYKRCSPIVKVYNKCRTQWVKTGSKCKTVPVKWRSCSKRPVSFTRCRTFPSRSCSNTCKTSCKKRVVQCKEYQGWRKNCTGFTKWKSICKKRKVRRRICTGYKKWKTYCKTTYAKRRTCTQYKRVWNQCKWFPTRHRRCYRYHNWVNYCRRASRGNRSRFIRCLKKRRHYRYYRGCYRYFSYYKRCSPIVKVYNKCRTSWVKTGSQCKTVPVKWRRCVKRKVTTVTCTRVPVRYKRCTKVPFEYKKCHARWVSTGGNKNTNPDN